MEPRTRQALAYLSDYIYRHEYDTNWPMAVDVSGYEIDWDNHPRLTRAQSFRDDDYPQAVYRFISEVFQKDQSSFRIMMAYIFHEKVPDDPGVNGALTTLGVIAGDPSRFPISLPLAAPVRLIDVETFPDDFYREIVGLINRAYEAAIYPAVPILIRKLLENLLVDILRSYYGTHDVSIFYDDDHGKFHDFGILIGHTRSRLSDFKWCGDLMNDELLRQLDKYREQGNASAHSITTTTSREEIEKNREEITNIARKLFKVFLLTSTQGRSRKV
jgi:hypothetical protein